LARKGESKNQKERRQEKIAQGGKEKTQGGSRIIVGINCGWVVTVTFRGRNRPSLAKIAVIHKQKTAREIGRNCGNKTSGFRKTYRKVSRGGGKNRRGKGRDLITSKQSRKRWKVWCLELK